MLNRQGIIVSDVTDKVTAVTSQRKRFPDKFHQIFANKRKLGSLQEYGDVNGVLMAEDVRNSNMIGKRLSAESSHQGGNSASHTLLKPSP